jgi:hypothetical protein
MLGHLGHAGSSPGGSSTSTHLFAIAVIAAGAALGGCGGGESGEAFVGTYQVTAHHANSVQGATVSCADPGPVAVGEPYIALIVDPFFDDPDFIRLQQCTAPGACVDELVTMSPGGPGLEELTANTQTGGGVTSCGLYAGRATAQLTGDVVRVEVRSWAEFVDLPASDCTLGRAEALRGTDQCREVETWDATRVAP